MIDPEKVEGEVKLLDKKDVDVKTNLKGEFLYANGEVYYHASPSNSNAGGTIGGQESQIKESVEANFTWVEYYKGYSVASQPNRGYYQYTGNEETVVIPKSINGDELTSYYRMFYETGYTVKKVVSQNENITSVANMFESSNVESLDLSNFKTSKITDMSRMFYRAQKLTDVNMSKWDTSNVYNMDSLFSNTVAELDVSNWNTSRVTKMNSMFSYNPNLKVLDLTSFGGFSKVKATSMFQGSTGLQDVYVSDSTVAAALETKYAFPNVFKVKQ